MALYADTCILLSLFFRDTGTPVALDWLDGAATEKIVITPWTRAEFASADGIMTRRGDISPALHHEGLARFNRLIDARFIVESLVNADFDRATTWIADYRNRLRAGDALHLAACARLNAKLCTTDVALADAAAAIGMEVHRMSASRE